MGEYIFVFSYIQRNILSAERNICFFFYQMKVVCFRWIMFPFAHKQKMYFLGWEYIFEDINKLSSCSFEKNIFQDETRFPSCEQALPRGEIYLHSDGNPATRRSYAELCSSSHPVCSTIFIILIAITMTIIIVLITFATSSSSSMKFPASVSSPSPMSSPSSPSKSPSSSSS